MRFTLFAAARGEAWRDAALGAASAVRIPMRAFTIGPGADIADPEDAWMSAYGVGRDGAVLVRPDGHVAWRSRSGVARPRHELESAFRAMLGRGA
jgi:hypothetical protein